MITAHARKAHTRVMSKSGKTVNVTATTVKPKEDSEDSEAFFDALKARFGTQGGYLRLPVNTLHGVIDLYATAEGNYWFNEELDQVGDEELSEMEGLRKAVVSVMEGFCGPDWAEDLTVSFPAHMRDLMKPWDVAA